MNVMKKILLPTDFSKSAWNAITYALQLLKDEACTFYLLNAYTPVVYRMDYLIGGPAVSAIPDYGIDVSLAGLERTVEQIEKEYPNPKHHFEMISEFSTLTDEVDNICGNVGIDLIVMGTTGASGAEEIFLGSNTVHVIKKAKVPVLAVPEDYTYEPLKVIMFPTDYQRRFKIDDVEPLFHIASKFNATLHVVHTVENGLSPKQIKNKNFLKGMLENIPCKFQDVTNDAMPSLVHSYVSRHSVDLVVMMNRKHTFLQRLFLKQNVDSVGYHCAVPFLVLPDISET